MSLFLLRHPPEEKYAWIWVLLMCWPTYHIVKTRRCVVNFKQSDTHSTIMCILFFTIILIYIQWCMAWAWRFFFFKSSTFKDAIPYSQRKMSQRNCNCLSFRADFQNCWALPASNGFNETCSLNHWLKMGCFGVNVSTCVYVWGKKGLCHYL